MKNHFENIIINNPLFNYVKKHIENEHYDENFEKLTLIKDLKIDALDLAYVFAYYQRTKNIRPENLYVLLEYNPFAKDESDKNLIKAIKTLDSLDNKKGVERAYKAARNMYDKGFLGDPKIVLSLDENVTVNQIMELIKKMDKW